MTFKRSKKLGKVMAVMYLLAAGACISASLPIVFKVVILLGVGVHYSFFNKDLNQQCCALKYSEALGWEFNDGGGFTGAQILPSTVISTAVMFLHIEIQAMDTHINHSQKVFSAGKSRQMKSLLILKDMLSEDDYRRLVVKIKISVIK